MSRPSDNRNTTESPPQETPLALETSRHQVVNHHAPLQANQSNTLLATGDHMHPVYYPMTTATISTDSIQRQHPTTGLQAVYYPLPMDTAGAPNTVPYSIDTSQTTSICLQGHPPHPQTQNASCSFDQKYLEDYLKVIESFQGQSGAGAQMVYPPPPANVVHHSPVSVSVPSVTGGYHTPQQTATPVPTITTAPLMVAPVQTIKSPESEDIPSVSLAAAFNNMHAHAFLHPPKSTKAGLITGPLSLSDCSETESLDSIPAKESEYDSTTEQKDEELSDPDYEGENFDLNPVSSDVTEFDESVNINRSDGVGNIPTQMFESSVISNLDANASEQNDKQGMNVGADIQILVPLQMEPSEENAGSASSKATRFLPPRKKRKDYCIIDEEDAEGDEKPKVKVNRRKRGRPKKTAPAVNEVLCDGEEGTPIAIEGIPDSNAVRKENTKKKKVKHEKGEKGTETKRPRYRTTKTCEKCNRRFERNDTYQRHMVLHDTKLMFGCHVCGGKYERQEHLTRHLRTHSGELYCCDICHETFTQQRTFKDHMLTYHNERRAFICNIAGCTFRAMTPSQVEKHSEIHSDQKQYRCEKCGRDFAQINGLRSHQRSCYEKRQYLCDFCGQKFNFLGSLKSHRHIHTGDKPYECPECDAKFTDHRNLRRHRLIHENAYPYPCTMCDKKFRHSNSLKAHLKMHVSSSTSTNATSATSANPTPSHHHQSSIIHSSTPQMVPPPAGLAVPAGITAQWERPEAQLVHEYMLALQHQASQVTQQVSQVTQV